MLVNPLTGVPAGLLTIVTVGNSHTIITMADLIILIKIAIVSYISYVRIYVYRYSTIQNKFL